MYVMGTAGHVDHGKSTLVTALSGIDPDRLPEEKARGMTIDLGFAWMTTKSGETIGIIDVPGHERFVRNMIAGVGAIDFVLLVVAADDGWMPQSAEHFAILRYLGVARGIIVITKSDLAEPDWLELVRADVREQVSGTFLADAPIIAVDSVSGRGIDELCGAIDEMTGALVSRPDLGRPRLYVDRVFTIAGRGAVVTGTLLDGSLSVGDSIMLEPGGVAARVRDLQIHKHQVTTAAPGQRLAINFSGVDRADLHRGQCVVVPADTLTVDRLWVHLGIWTEAVQPLKPGRKVLVMLGTAEPEADAYPVGQAAIAPGQEGLCELRLKEPIKARLKDHFVLRWPTPQVTIGGGEVLEIGGTRRSHRDAHFVECLRGRVDGELAAYRLTELKRWGFSLRKQFLSEGPWSEAEISAEIDRAIDAGEITQVAGILFDPVWLAEQGARMRESLQEAHRSHAYDAGLNLAEWQDKARIPAAAMAALVEHLLAGETVRRAGEAYHLADHVPRIPEAWVGEEKSLWDSLAGGGMEPPVRDVLEAATPHAKTIVQFWISTGRVVALGDGIVFPAETFSAIREKIGTALRDGSGMTAGQLRDLLGTTRKYSVPIGEALDREGLTRREGDVRVLAESS